METINKSSIHYFRKHTRENNLIPIKGLIDELIETDLINKPILNPASFMIKPHITSFPLGYAIECAAINIVRYILENNKSLQLNINTQFYTTYFSLALRKLKSNPSSTNLNENKFKNKMYKIISMLIISGTYTEILPNGVPSLIHAIMLDDHELIKLFVQINPNPNPKTTKTILDHASSRTAAQLLLQHGTSTHITQSCPPLWLTHLITTHTQTLKSYITPWLPEVLVTNIILPYSL